MNWFVGRHVKWLEDELEKRERLHRAQVEDWKLELAAAETRYAAEIADLKKAHADELGNLKKAHVEEWARGTTVTEQLRDEVDRLRKYLFPGMLTAKETAGDATPSPEVSNHIGGTPFQRISRRVMEEDEKHFNEAEARKRRLKEVAEQALKDVKQAESGGQAH